MIFMNEKQTELDTDILTINTIRNRTSLQVRRMHYDALPIFVLFQSQHRKIIMPQHPSQDILNMYVLSDQ